VNKTLLSLSCLLLAGCAGSGTGSSNVPASPALPLQVDPLQAGDTAEPALANVRQVDIRSLPDEPVCRRAFQTGSRIAIERCDTPNDADDSLNDYITRQEVEYMRQQQTYRDQARRMREAAARQLAVGGRRE
jgi:hypothetical protein